MGGIQTTFVTKFDRFGPAHDVVCNSRQWDSLTQELFCLWCVKGAEMLWLPCCSTIRAELHCSLNCFDKHSLNVFLCFHRFLVNLNTLSRWCPGVISQISQRTNAFFYSLSSVFSSILLYCLSSSMLIPLLLYLHVLQSIWFVLLTYFLLSCVTSAWSSVSSWISDFNSQLFFHHCHCLSPKSSWRGADIWNFLLPTDTAWESTPHRFPMECVPNRSIIWCRTEIKPEQMYIDIKCDLRDYNCSCLWMDHPPLQEIARLVLRNREAPQLG